MRIAPLTGLTALGLAACAAMPSTADRGSLAADWNLLLLEVAEAEDGFLTLKGVRAAAMMHLAMHDALNAVDHRYEAYAWSGEAALADPVAAAVHAAHEVATAQYPGRAAEFTALRRRHLAGSDRAGAGRAAGLAAAAAILAQRADDGWNGDAEYTWHPMAPGVYAEFHEHSDTPQGFVFGAGWAKARPFLLARQGQFRSPPPPPIDSDEYTRAYDEVREVGRRHSTSRTADQTHLAMWWKDFVENSHNRLARRLLGREPLDLWQACRMFALLNASVFDAYVNVFDNKFHYNHWRPYTAIRWAAHDGNPDTVPEPEWDNMHGHTYAFPSYPSAHGCAAAAAMTVLADAFGTGTSFRMYTPRVDRAGPMSGKIDMDPPYRDFENFAQAALECAMSRVYLGIHFRYDSVEGNVLGTRIGRYGLEHALRPVP